MGLFKMLRGKVFHHHKHLKSRTEEHSLVVDETPPSVEAVGWVVPSHDKQHADYTHTEASATGFQTTVLREEARSIIAHATNAPADEYATLFVGTGCTGMSAHKPEYSAGRPVRLTSAAVTGRGWPRLGTA